MAHLTLPVELTEQIEGILAETCRKARAECILLADVSGQLVSTLGDVESINPVLVVTLAAADVAAMGELSRQIGEQETAGGFLHEGKRRSIYLFAIAESFVMVILFPVETPVGLVRLYAGRAAERLAELVAEFEEWIQTSSPVPDDGFDVALAEELDKAFEGL